MKMNTILLSIIVLLYGELSFSQNEFSPASPAFESTSEMKPSFPINLQPGDALKTTQAIQDFNKKSESIGWRTDKLIQLDSIVKFIPDFTYAGLQRAGVRAFEYNDADQDTSAYYFQVSPIDGDTTGGLRENFTYNDLHQLIQYDYSLWQDATMSWLVMARQKLEYNEDGLLSGYIISYVETDSLEMSSKSEITYNGFQKPSLVLGFDWNKDQMIWEESVKEEYTYTPYQLSTETLSHKIDSLSTWEFLSKTDYGYGQGLLLNKTVSYWDVNVWARISRSYFYYDNLGNLILEKDKVWNDPPQMWLDDVEYKYEYDNAKRRISATDRSWFEDGHEWIIGDSTAFAYNSFSDTSLVVGYYWSYGDETWKENSFSLYEYDPETDFSTIRWPMSYLDPIGSTFNKQVKAVLNSNRFNGDSDSSVYYYSFIVASSEIPTESWSVYPNPAHEDIHICSPYSETADEVEIFSLDGKLMKSVFMQNETNIPVEDLTSGVYVFRIKRGNIFLTGKFIKQ